MIPNGTLVPLADLPADARAAYDAWLAAVRAGLPAHARFPLTFALRAAGFLENQQLLRDATLPLAQRWALCRCPELARQAAGRMLADPLEMERTQLHLVREAVWRCREQGGPIPPELVAALAPRLPGIAEPPEILQCAVQALEDADPQPAPASWEDVQRLLEPVRQEMRRLREAA